ncbi:MAG: LptF/LptG family permease [Bacteroidetes bacterium]|nr:LptF/LptG family permease [Bacteroidota bacterium]
MKRLDVFIVKKFLGTFFFAIILIIGIAIIFDFSEKIDDFMENSAPLEAILRDYYLNFIPYFAVLFSSLFTLISVIFFTSKMAYNTEIIAILSNGISFRRMLVPYFVSATVITIMAIILNNYAIPHANEKRFEFEERYYHSSPRRFTEKHIHKQIEPGLFVYMDNYSTASNTGYKFSMEYFENGNLKSKLLSDYIRWDTTTNKWKIYNYWIRDYLPGGEQKLTLGRNIDTTLNMHPEEFKRRDNVIESMSLGELNDFIDEQRMQGSPNIPAYLVEKYKRFAFPFSTFILTVIGVSVSSRKVRGGIGMHIGLGMLIGFTYILFMQFSTQFAISGAFSPMLAVWTPNIIFTFVAIILYKLAPK